MKCWTTFTAAAGKFARWKFCYNMWSQKTSICDCVHIYTYIQATSGWLCRSATRLRAGELRNFGSFPGWTKVILFSKLPTASGGHKASDSTGAAASFFEYDTAGVNLNTITVIKSTWNCISTPPYAFLAWCLIKYRDKLTIYLIQYLQVGEKYCLNCEPQSRL